MSVYEPNNFSQRVSLACATIRRRGNTTRHFDTCFEMFDGDAVAAAIWKKAQTDTRLMANLPQYINADNARFLSAHYAGRKLSEVARELRNEAIKQGVKTMTEENETPNHQEVEIVVRIKLSMPTNKEGEIIDAEEYCAEVRDTILVAFKDRLADVDNSADAVDVLECREEAELYHPTQEQAFARLQAAKVELESRMDDLQQTLDM